MTNEKQNIIDEKWTKGARPMNDALAEAVREYNQVATKVRNLFHAWNRDLCDREDELARCNHRQRELNELTRAEVVEAWRIYDAILAEREKDRSIPRPVKPGYPRDFLRKK